MTNRIFKEAVRTGLSLLVVYTMLAQPAHSADFVVTNASQLANAVTSANDSGGNTIIRLQNGTYTLTDTLYVNVPNVTVASVSGNRESVIIQGDAMNDTAKIGNIFRVAASNFEIRDVTLQRCGWHLIQVVGESNADFSKVQNCVLRDSYQQMLKVTPDPANPNVTADNGIVEGCLFEYSTGIGPQYYIGGIDAHGAKNWIVRNNTFRFIISPSVAVAEFAVHFWNNSANNTVEKNLVVDCDRAIGFGLDTKPNTGGVIRNNMIYHSANKGQFADVAIALSESPGSQIYNNTILMENDFPWAVEYRFTSTTNVLIANNLTNKPIMSRDGGAATVTKNVINAAPSWFTNPLTGDLHLASALASVVDAGQPISGLTDDFDGHVRPQGSGFDIGADEFLGISSAPKPPRNLRCIEP